MQIHPPIGGWLKEQALLTVFSFKKIGTKLKPKIMPHYSYTNNYKEATEWRKSHSREPE